MSVNYVIREHLMIENTEHHSVAMDGMLSHLSLLEAWLLQERARVYRFVIHTDDKTYDCHCESMTKNYQDAMCAFADATKVEMILHYEYNYRVPEADPGPFDFIAYLQKTVENEPESLDGLFYSMYNNADCNEGEGIVCAYGKKDGVLYTGKIPFVPVSNIPAGQWYTTETSVGCDIDPRDGFDMQSVEQVCRALATYNESNYTLHISKDEFSFYLNELSFETDAQLKHFIALCGQLKALLGEECFILGAVTEISGTDVKMLHFAVDESGAYTMELASVD
ncbi:MAG: hypothetical protein IKV74_05250 [Clostridia bacterium]|nr:hypothetical protein [Clostridia bacterium]